MIYHGQKHTCMTCKNTLPYGCKAYPMGIPYEIAEGIVPHIELRGDEDADFIYQEGVANPNPSNEE